jgi:PAS domain-containing protein
MSSATFVRFLGATQRSAAQALRKINEALREENLERRRAEERLRQLVDLLDLTHDTIFVRDMNDVITYWNHGAEELYGWTKEEAVGQVSQRLIQTICHVPREQISANLARGVCFFAEPFVSGELLDAKAAKEVDELAAVFPKDFRS